MCVCVCDIMGIRKEKEGREGKEEKKRTEKKERKKTKTKTVQWKRREGKEQKHVQYRSIILVKFCFVFVVTLYNSSAKQQLIKVMCIYNRSLLLR